MATGNGVVVDIFVEDKSVEAMLFRLDTALNPIAIGGFLQGEIDPYIRLRARNRFAGEGDDVVGNWAPLQEATQSIREQMGYGASHPINRREGELENYVVNSPNSLAVAPNGTILTMPGNRPQGELADKVTTAQQGKQNPATVARPVIGINERDLAFILTSLATYIVNPVGSGAAG